MTDSFEVIVETLRARVLRLVHSGSLSAGDRLPSARALAKEFGVDFRMILNAYRVLEEEQLVNLKARGGVYVAEPLQVVEGSPLPALWIAELLAQGLSRDLPASELHDLIRRCTETLRLRAAVIAPTEDQAFGLRRELTEDFGLDTSAFAVDAVRNADPLPVSLRRADVLVTIAANLDDVREIARKLGIPVLQVQIRPDFATGEWSLLLRQPVYAVVATEEFGKMLKAFFSEQPGVENLHVVVHGRDDLKSIPQGAQVYVTQRVRAAMADGEVPGNALPPARTISSASAREIFSFIVRANADAMVSLRKSAAR